MTNDMELLTAAETAKMLHVSKQTLVRWRQEGYGPHWFRYSPRTIRYPLESVLAFRRAKAEMRKVPGTTSGDTGDSPMGLGVPGQ
jgi:hypothetical protein